MGNGCFAISAQESARVYMQDPYVSAYQMLFESMKLNGPDAVKLRKVFDDINVSQSGAIDYHEWLDFLHQPNNPWNQRVFEILDENDDSVLDFREFVVSIWNYCLSGRSGLVTLCFDMYDDDNSGTIDREQFVNIMLDVFPGETRRHLKQNPLAHAILNRFANLRRHDHCPENELTLDLFGKVCEKHMTLLERVFQTQNMIKKKCCGHKFWDRVSSRKMETTDGVEVSLAAFLESHTDHNALLTLGVRVAEFEMRKAKIEAGELDEKAEEAAARRTAGPLPFLRQRKSKKGEPRNEEEKRLKDARPKFMDAHGMTGSVSNRRKAQGITGRKVKAKKRVSPEEEAIDDEEGMVGDPNRKILKNSEMRRKREAKKDQQERKRYEAQKKRLGKQPKNITEKRKDDAAKFNFERANQQQDMDHKTLERELPPLIT